MGRRKSEEEGIAVLILGAIILAIFACLSFLMPFGWIGTEIWRLVRRFPKEGFRFTEEEMEEASDALNGWGEANGHLEGLHEYAHREGCNRRADGRYDERRGIAREINASVEMAEVDLMMANDRLDTALSPPHQRWSAWATPRKWAWAFRAAMASWAFIWTQGMLKASSIASSLPAEMQQEALAVGTSATLVGTGLGIAGLISGAVGYGIGAALTAGKRPIAGSDLYMEQSRENLAGLEEQLAAMDDDLDGMDDDDDDVTEAELARSLAMGSASIMRYIAGADGTLSELELHAINSMVRTSFEEHEGAAEAFDAMLMVEDMPAEHVENACRLAIQLNPEIGPVTLHVAILLTKLSGSDAAEDRLAELAEWFELTPEEVATCYEDAMDSYLGMTSG